MDWGLGVCGTTPKARRITASAVPGCPVNLDSRQRRTFTMRKFFLALFVIALIIVAIETFRPQPPFPKVDTSYFAAVAASLLR